MPETDPQAYISLDCPRCGAPLPEFAEEIVCQYCGARLIFKHARTAPPRPAPARPADPQSLTLVPLTYVEPRTQLDAFTISLPPGWQFEGGITWQNKASAPALLGFRIFNPGGIEQMECFPNQYFGWSTNPMFQMQIPLGGDFYQSEFRPPLSAADFLQQNLIPRQRSKPGMRVLSAQPDPRLAQKTQSRLTPSTPQQQFSVDAARVQIEYQENGLTLREELLANIVYMRVIAGGLFGSVESLFWYTDGLIAWRVRAADFELLHPIFDRVLDSYQPNPQFIAAVQQISQQMTNGVVQQIRNFGQAALRIGRQLSQMNEMQWQSYWDRQHHQEQMWDSWHANQARVDQVHQDYTQAIRGTDEYFDPNAGRTVELPSGYQQVWSNPLGEYIFSDDSLYNPNQESNGSWTLINPA
ncbi:hypothetical protein ADN00_11065 [Ornatilinea apprima]|uniref:Uncharacterized protein n=1 Tax=Ornatilinea apprima TaxID=1134406 RepID=A0A0P6X9U7_9CHLR|nr:zinc ribbon domain-containing protein [Ornatilinea apprima]KPL76505.1 hypothetical protein ADN00_11065 [Ornatilinea apprima]